jgi:predicted nucleotidyltransferase
MKNQEIIYQEFSREMQNLFQKDLISIVLFGSAATKDFVPGRSDINFLVGLTPEGIKNVDRVHSRLASWRRKNISLPLFLTRSYIQASLDSFPVEFLNMRSAYHVIYGEDILDGLSFRNEDLRLQCERELKGDLLKLRQGYLRAAGSTRKMVDLISQSLVAFVSIFRALLYLKNVSLPERRMEIITTACRDFGFDEDLFAWLLAVKKREVRPKKDELEKRLRRYIESVRGLTETVDKMKLTKP